jgi:hypothetical protein
VATEEPALPLSRQLPARLRARIQNRSSNAVIASAAQIARIRRSAVESPPKASASAGAENQARGRAKRHVGSTGSRRLPLARLPAGRV